MGMFSKVASAEASANGGDYIKPGHYFCRIDRVKAGESQQGNGGFVAIELTVVAAKEDGDLPVDSDFNKLTKEAWHTPGQQVSHLMMTKHASFLGNFKAFVANVGGIAADDVTEENCEAVTDGLFDGLFVEIRARAIKTRAGNPFTAVGYTREVPPQEIKDNEPEETLDLVLGKGKIDELIEAYDNDEE